MQKSLGIAWWKLGNKMRRCKLIKIRAVKLCMWDWIQIYLAIFYVLLYTVSIVVCHVFNFFFFFNFKSQLFYKGSKNNTWSARCIYLLLCIWACWLSFLPGWSIEFIILLLWFYQLCFFFIPFFLLLGFFYHWAFRKK